MTPADRAAQIIAATDAAERGYELDASDVAIGHTIAMSLDAAGLLATLEHDAAVAAKALREAVSDVLEDGDPDDMGVAAWLQMRADHIEREGGGDA